MGAGLGLWDSLKGWGHRPPGGGSKLLISPSPLHGSEDPPATPKGLGLSVAGAPCAALESLTRAWRPSQSLELLHAFFYGKYDGWVEGGVGLALS